jgi:hypothetical protein
VVLTFENTKRVKAVLRLHPERITRFYIDVGGARLPTSSRFRSAVDIDLVIVPTLAPLEIDEQYVHDDTVRRNAGTRLASLVLRNIWLRKTQEEFYAFKEAVEAAWPSIELQKPEMQSGNPAVVFAPLPVGVKASVKRGHRGVQSSLAARRRTVSTFPATVRCRATGCISGRCRPCRGI